MRVVRNAHRRELYNCKRQAGWRGEPEREERGREGGREAGREADIFPLHACSCSDQLEYFSQLFQRQPTLSLKDGRGERSGKFCFPATRSCLNHTARLSGFPHTGLFKVLQKGIL